ncbi:MAG: hypothetical protein ACLRMJ_05635 [Alistipes finegoldii]
MALPPLAEISTCRPTLATRYWATTSTRPRSPRTIPNEAKFIRENRAPFFLYLAHLMPHVPRAARQIPGKRNSFYGDVMMEADWSVGEAPTLEELGLERNTLERIFTRQRSVDRLRQPCRIDRRPARAGPRPSTEDPACRLSPAERDDTRARFANGWPRMTAADLRPDRPAPLPAQDRWRSMLPLLEDPDMALVRDALCSTSGQQSRSRDRRHL